MTIIHCKTPQLFLCKNEKQEKTNVFFRPFEDVRSGMPTYDPCAIIVRRMRLYIRSSIEEEGIGGRGRGGEGGGGGRGGGRGKEEGGKE